MTFSTPRFFLAHEECFAYDTVSWKLLAGTFQTNVSQVRLETYRNIPSGVSHGFTKAQGAMKPKTPFSLKQGDKIQNFNMRRRVIQKFVAGPCLRDFMEQRQLWNEPLAAALLFSRAKIIFFWAEFSSLID